MIKYLKLKGKKEKRRRKKSKRIHRSLNPGPLDYKSDVLPTELPDFIAMMGSSKL